MSKLVCTRSNNKVWLLGFPSDILSSSRLPSGQDVMHNFLHFHKQKKLTIAKSAASVYDQLVTFWLKSGLPITQKLNIIKKIKSLYDQYCHLVKNRKRSNESDKLHQRKYGTILQKLFDISHANADKMMTNEKDRTFLKLQRDTRAGYIGSVDKKLAAKENRSAERKERFTQHLLMNKNIASASPKKELPISSDEEDESGSEQLINDFHARTRNSSKDKSKRLKIVTSPISASLD